MQRRSFLGLSLASIFSFFGLPSPKASAASLDTSKPITRIAFGSCMAQDKAQPIWNKISADHPDLFLFIGDNIYADTEDMAEMARKYKQLGDKPEFIAFRHKVPVLATWDDHDFGINDGGKEYPRKAESKKQMLDFFGEPEGSERRKRDGVYTSYMMGPAGKRLQIVLLDLRWWRTPLIWDKKADGYVPNPDPTATMMGDTQWQWLENELKKPADLRIIASSTQFSPPDHNWEKWANFPLEKKRMIDTIDRLGLKNVLFVTGDMHYGELSAEQTPKGTTLFDLTSSGMNFFETGTQYPNRNRLALHDTSPNYGFVEINWNKQKIAVNLQVRDDNGISHIDQRVHFDKA